MIAKNIKVRRKGAWTEWLLIVLVVFNVGNAVAYRWIPPVDEAKSTAYLALAVAFTACLIARRRP